jgi:hypothetical protein
MTKTIPIKKKNTILTPSIRIDTVSELKTMLQQLYTEVVAYLEQRNLLVDVSKPLPPVEDYHTLCQYPDYTAGPVSLACSQARIEFIKHLNTLPPENKKFLLEFKFDFHFGLDKVEKTTFAKAFGYGDHPRPHIITSLLLLWGFVVTVAPADKNQIPRPLQDYACHHLIYFDKTKSTGWTRSNGTSSRLRLFDTNIGTQEQLFVSTFFSHVARQQP